VAIPVSVVVGAFIGFCFGAPALEAALRIAAYFS
jgi:hypothetical protein